MAHSRISFPALGPGAATASHSLVAPAKANDLFAVTSDPRVELFSVRKREPLKTIGRFDSDTYSGDIRPDGRVLVAGEDSGKIQIFGVGGGTRAVVLKTWHVHKQLVWVTHRSPTDLTTLISASNDEFIVHFDKARHHEDTRSDVVSGTTNAGNLPLESGLRRPRREARMTMWRLMHDVRGKGQHR